MKSRPIVYVTALTYMRPEGLSNLLEAFEQLKIPDETDVRFLIVDNDPGASAKSIVEKSRRGFLHRLDYVVEQKPGIAVARNRALIEAISGNGDYLCFTDDDAVPDADWLIELLRCQSEARSVLVLGPAVLSAPSNLSGMYSRLLARSLVARSRFVAWYVDRTSRKGDVYFGATANLLMDLKWIHAHGIRFDESLVESGDEDTAFIKQVRDNKGRISWCSSAVIQELLPLERISIKYQFQRSRGHGMTFSHFRNKGKLPFLRIPGARLVVGVFLMVFPVIGFASFTLGLHMIGMQIGIIEGAMGRRSKLYSR